LGDALVFDGKSGALKLSAGLMEGRKAFSVSFWFKTLESRAVKFPTQAPSLLGQVSKGSGSGDLVILTNSGKIGLFHGLRGKDQKEQSTLKVNDGKWHHTALVSDPNKGLNVFVDGREVISSEPATRGMGGKPLAAGASNRIDGLGAWHQCSLDELMIWDRPLSGAEISALKALRYRPPPK